MILVFTVEFDVFYWSSKSFPSYYLCCSQSVSSDIDDVIDTTGDLPIAVFVSPGAVSSEIIARVG